MISRAMSLAQAVPGAPGVPGAHAAPAARPAPAIRPGRDPAPAAAPHDGGLAAPRLAGVTRARVLRLAGTEAALVAALGTGLAAVVTAVTVAAARRGPAGVAPPSGAAVPWVPLAAIGLVCLVVAVLGSVLAARAALRDPGQTLTAAAGA
jgi:hypothetical protein